MTEGRKENRFVVSVPSDEGLAGIALLRPPESGEMLTKEDVMDLLSWLIVASATVYDVSEEEVAASVEKVFQVMHKRREEGAS